MGKIICLECGEVFDGLLPKTKSNDRSVVNAHKLLLASRCQCVKITYSEAKTIMGYLEGHDIGITVDGCCHLYRHDWQNGDDFSSDEEYSLVECLYFCIDMAMELLETELTKDDPDGGYIKKLYADVDVLTKIEGMAEKAVPAVCLNCDGVDCLARSFADDTDAMKWFPKVDRDDFLSRFPQYSKKEYAATIRELGVSYFAEQLGWDITKEGDNEFYVSQFSPAGEDFGINVTCDGSFSKFADAVTECYEDFDVDDHIEMWIEAKRNGVGGVPSTRQLVKDAEDIDDMLRQLSDWLDLKVEEMEDWE